MEPCDFYEFLKEDFGSSLSQPTGIKQSNQQPTGMNLFDKPPPLTPKAKEQARVDNLQNMAAKYHQPTPGRPSVPVQLAAWGQKEVSPEEAEEMMHDFDALSSAGMQVPDALKKAVYRNARRKSRISPPPVPNPNLPAWMQNSRTR